MSAAAPDTSAVEVDRSSGLATVSWARPDVANAFDQRLTRELDEVLTDLDQDSEIEICVLQGRGRHFTSGWDLNELRKRSDDLPSELEKYFSAGTELLEAISAMRPVVVARPRGATAGFGVALAGRCDLVIADPNGCFGCPEILAGVVPRLVAADLVGLVDVRTALAWLATGRLVSAAEAHAAGLVSLVLDEAEFARQLETWRALTVEHPGCLKATKGVARHLRTLPPDRRRARSVEMTVTALLSGTVPP